MARAARAARGRPVSPAKARTILHDKEVRGHPLTEKQRGFFGAIASGSPAPRNAPPTRRRAR
jgi:hypothetical protein